jgi:hypothetical protein
VATWQAQRQRPQRPRKAIRLSHLEPDGLDDRPHAFSSIPGLIAPVCLAATISNATTAPAPQEAEDRYIGARDRLGNLRRKGEDEYTRCFTQNAPKQASFAEATRQAQQLLSTALDRR